MSMEKAVKLEESGSCLSFLDLLAVVYNIDHVSYLSSVSTRLLRPQYLSCHMTIHSTRSIKCLTHHPSSLISDLLQHSSLLTPI